ncbi:MAG: tyrosine--tRNA ligase [Patescibacteria group bacterium]|nr:tyrosine--tRNA ligase [Patescibacteria group bacterium]
MTKVIIDKNKIKEVLERGVENIYPDRNSLEKVLLSGKRIKLYCGFDPSASSLHIGNAIQLNKLAQFQALGHEVIFLIGDFTGMIGDPTDKSAARKKMTRKEVLANAKNYKKQASAYLNFSGSNPAKIMYNSKWHDKLNFKDLIEVTSNFTAQQMFARDMFQERIKQEKPIYLHEFLYPVAQAYDSVVMDVDLEIGGNDQMFNMLCGRDLMKAMKGKEKFVLTTELLVDPTGKKMGKTEGNIVNLDENPKDMYGKIMSWPDGVIIPGFELCTKIPMDEAEKIKKELAGGKANPRDFKMKLAYEITKINWGEKKAQEAQEYFIKTIQKKEAPDEVRSKKLSPPGRDGKVKSSNIVDLLVEVELASSKSEARRLIEQGGIKVEGEVVKDINKKIEIKKDGVLVQRGKRQFVRVIGN